MYNVLVAPILSAAVLVAVSCDKQSFTQVIRVLNATCLIQSGLYTREKWFFKKSKMIPV
jgi:predicted transporter